MSSRTKKSLSIRTELVLVFAGIFLIATTVPLALTLYLTFVSLEESQRSEFADKSLELHNAFDRGGLKMVKKIVELDTTLGLDSPYFARICSIEDNGTIFSSTPKGWKEFGFTRLSDTSLPEDDEIIILQSPQEDYSVEILSTKLSERYMLQIGGSTKMRDQVVSASLDTFLLVMIPSTILLLTMLWYLSSIMLKPVSDIVGVVREVIHTGRYDRKVPLRKSAAEFEELIELINRMFSRLEQLITNMKNTLQQVAHDIRTPMTRIQSRAEISVREQDNAEGTQESLYSIIEESQRVSTLLQFILDASAAESGIVELEEEKTDLSLLCEEAAEVYEYVAEEKDITIETHIARSIQLSADPARLQQAVGNLLENAIKYSYPGTTVELHLEYGEQHIRIRIRDEGPGLDESSIEDIWKPRFRAGNGGKSAGGGTAADGGKPGGYGLGLTIVSAITEAHGGTVQACNRSDGNGAEFVISLPSVRAV